MDGILGRFAPHIYALLRIVAGLLFAQHGAQKLLGVLGGNQVAIASQFGLAGIIELVGGLMIAVGVYASVHRLHRQRGDGGGLFSEPRAAGILAGAERRRARGTLLLRVPVCRRSGQRSLEPAGRKEKVAMEMMTHTRRIGALAVLLTIALSGSGMSGSGLGVASTAQAPAAGAAEVRTWYFYTVKWGSQDEFLDLFQRNHYPVLKARMEAGHYLSVRTYTPRYHGDGRADWTFAVELVERPGSTGLPTEAEIVKKLYPDQAKFRREEQRRFELLAAHWDTPLTAVDFEKRAVSR